MGYRVKNGWNEYFLPSADGEQLSDLAIALASPAMTNKR
jgi:hypothetical protein